MTVKLTNIRAGYAEFTHGETTYTVIRTDTSEGPVWDVHAVDTTLNYASFLLGGRKRRQDAVNDATEALEIEDRKAAYDPAKTYVTVGDWCVSGTGGPDGYELKVYTFDDDAPNDMGGKGVIHYHPEHSGLHFPDWNEATRHAFAHGFLQEYTPAVRDAARAALAA